MFGTKIPKGPIVQQIVLGECGRRETSQTGATRLSWEGAGADPRERPRRPELAPDVGKERTRRSVDGTVVSG